VVKRKKKNKKIESIELGSQELIRNEDGTLLPGKLMAKSLGLLFMAKIGI
jgi:hypothetical protein